MKEYTYRRTVFYQLYENAEWPDDHANFDITFCDNKSKIVDDAVGYLTKGENHLQFPGAARAVAIAAAKLIEEHFGNDFYEVLNDPNLMHGNDPHFKPYSEDKETYDAILKKTKGRINWGSYRMGLSKQLILEEYLLDSNGLKFMSRQYSRAECKSS